MVRRLVTPAAAFLLGMAAAGVGWDLAARLDGAYYDRRYVIEAQCPLGLRRTSLWRLDYQTYEVDC